MLGEMDSFRRKIEIIKKKIKTREWNNSIRNSFERLTSKQPSKELGNLKTGK